RVKELSEQIILSSSRCEQQEAKIEAVTEQAALRQGELNETDQSVSELAKRHEVMRDEHNEGDAAIGRLQNELEDEKAGTIDLLRRTAQLHNEIHGLGIRRQTLHGQQDQLTNRAEQIDRSLADILRRRSESEAKLRDVEGVLCDASNRLDAAGASHRELIENQQAMQRQLAAAREQRSALESRTETLREMQRKLEGVTAGVRRILKGHRDGRLRFLRGMLGDLIRTDMSRAPVVEAALAGADQNLLADKLSDVEAARDEFADVLGDGAAGEVLCLDSLPPFVQDFTPADIPQVLGCVIDWVEFDAWLAPVMWRLLGRTLVVETLRDAVTTSTAAPGKFRFVTLTGDVLEADGRVRIGAANRTAGVIARTSELIELQRRREQLDEQIAELQDRCTKAQAQLTHLDETQQKLRTAIYEANTERVEYQSLVTQLEGQVSELEREKPLVGADLKHIAAEIDAAVRAEHDTEKSAAELERLNAEGQAEVERLSEQLNTARRRQEELTGEMTELKVELGRTEEKKRSIREAIDALDNQRQQMLRDVTATRKEIDLNRQRRTDAEAGISTAREQIDELYARCKELNKEAADLEESRQGLTRRLEEIRTELSERRKEHETAAGELNTHRVELGESDVRIDNLITRASDEMGMKLLELYRDYQHDDQRDWDAVDGEIKQLRGKIERLGNVNLDAITEQEQLEQRRDFLSAQLADIRSSRNQLNELIRRINRESKQLFETTFQAVREHFQQLFRKLFGGGRADIYLNDPDDVLESGIEIVARPPGKELRSLSLLSGGEKTMTALALLFSIFRAKPSPFCLLDEVDAALDET
ncbi:MAG: coiled-coil domain-containing protein, partial [Planctomycetota bacterium]